MGVCVGAMWAQCGRPYVSEKILCCWELLLRAAAGGVLNNASWMRRHLCEVASDNRQCFYLEKDVMLLGAAAGGVMSVRILIVRSASGVVDAK